MDNKLLKYRLRALFPTQFEVNSTRVHVDAPFDVLVREPEENITAYCCDTFQSVVNLFDTNSRLGIAIATRGIKEYDTIKIMHRNAQTKLLTEHVGLAISLLRPTAEIGDWGTFPVDTKT
jgi:alpha-mannosidase